MMSFINKYITVYISNFSGAYQMFARAGKQVIQCSEVLP